MQVEFSLSGLDCQYAVFNHISLDSTLDSEDLFYYLCASSISTSLWFDLSPPQYETTVDRMTIWLTCSTEKSGHLAVCVTDPYKSQD